MFPQIKAILIGNKPVQILLIGGIILLILGQQKALPMAENTSSMGLTVLLIGVFIFVVYYALRAARIIR